MPIVVSKTDYLLYRECPKNAWMKIHRPDIYYMAELSEFEKSIIETGNEVELAARELFPSGVLIEGRDESDRQKTQDLMRRNEGTIFQPVFLKDGLLAAADILQFDAETSTWSLFEVKASNSIKEKIHLADLAFQAMLLERSGVKLGKIGILHLNPEYVRGSELDLIKLFVTDDISETIRNMIPEVRAEAEEAIAYLTKTDEPSGNCCCIYKGRSQHCATFAHSNPLVPEYSVHDIARIGVSKTKLTELVDGGFYHVHEVPEYIKLSEIQQNQVNAAITGRPIIKNDKIAQEFRGLAFPLYFLDYETFPCAIPRFEGFSPYQQIPFQYSLHVIEKAGDEPTHREFLHRGEDDPSRYFFASLKKDIGTIGSVIVWNKKFECKINEELWQRMPEARPFMDDLNGRVYDLMDVFSKQYYVHKDFMGSTSIKYVLPVLAPDLTYKDLEIREGGTASQKWNEMTMSDIDLAAKDQIARNLKEYCKLDTYAMYAIWKKLGEDM